MMMNRKLPLRVAVVGCGKIADGHVTEIAKLSTASVVAVCDREKLMAEQLATRFRLPAYYDSFEEMLNAETPDVVHITTPPQSHVALATQAIDAGCHVYVEKPISATFEESRRIISTAESASKKLTVGYTYHFDPVAEDLRQLIKDGTVGDPVHVESYYGYDLEGSFGKALANPAHWVHGLPGQVFHNNLDHALAKILEFIPDEDPEVVAKASRRGSTYGDARDNLLEELRIIIMGRDTTAYVTFTSNVKPVAHFLRLYGTRCSVHADFVSRAVVVERGSSVPSAIGRAIAPFGQSREYWRSGNRNLARFARSNFHYFAGMNRLLTLFYDAILEDGPVPIAYRDILRVAALQDRIYDQLPLSRTAGAQ